MTKRNTEGYVLAYLLIVIAVMGVIAASLMTSTLHVVQAQEKSLSYMKEKYEAMGEVEKAVAQLCVYTASSGFDYSGRKSPDAETFDPGTFAFDAAEEFFLSYMQANGYEYLNSPVYQDPIVTDDPDVITYPVIYPFSETITHGNVTIQFDVDVLVHIETNCKTKNELKIDPETLEPETDPNTGDPIMEAVRTYSYNLPIPPKPSFTRYEVSSKGDDAV